MLRSLLFIPGNNPAMLQNADVFGADAVILDLEDAVNPAEKDAARNLVGGYLHQLSIDFGQIFIRINGLDTAWYEADLEAVVSDHIDGIVLPKAKVTDVKMLSHLLFNLEASRQMKKTVQIIPIIESAKSVLQIEKIAGLSRVTGLLLGGEDLASEMETERTKQGDEILYPREMIAFACRAEKIDAIDTPFTDTNDLEGLRADCLKASGFGLNAKAAIHPNQLDIIHECFSPSSKRIDWALRVVAAAKKASEQGLGVFSLDGRMVDKPIIERAHKVLENAAKFHLIPEKHA
jgi:citrate lyase subunit beta/citryl-CoA lyase